MPKPLKSGPVEKLTGKPGDGSGRDGKFQPAEKFPNLSAGCPVLLLKDETFRGTEEINRGRSEIQTVDIPYVRLTPKQLEKCLGLMLQGNRLLKKWSEFYGSRKLREFRNKLFQGDKNPGNCIPKNRLKEFHRELPLILAIHETPYPDLGHQTVEWSMLCNYSALARKHAHRASNTEVGGNTFDDYLQEAYLCILDAIYSFTRDDIAFSTFAWAVLKNRMIQVINKANLLCPLTNTDLELVARYEQAKTTFNERVSFEQVVQAMNLSDEEIRVLNTAMTRVYCEHQLGDQQNESGDEEVSGNDYTSLRSVQTDDNNGLIVQMSLADCIERAGLTAFERIVLETSLHPYYGWQTDVAKKNVNPNTGKPYSRMWVTYALKNAHKKLRAVCNDAA